MKRKLYSILMILFSLLVWVTPAYAVSIPSGYNSWAQQTTTDSRKAWTVKFGAPMDRAVLNKNNIYVTDNNNTPVNTTLTQSADGASVTVKPVSPYISGNKYWLFVTEDITFEDGQHHLKKPVAMPFVVTNPNSKISSISNNYSSIVTSFAVTTSPEVFSVKINQTSMLYQGNDTYALGVTGLKLGSKVTVAAYDSSGKLLQSQVYIVN